MSIADELIERRNHLLLHPENHVQRMPTQVGEECLLIEAVPWPEKLEFGLPGWIFPRQVFSDEAARWLTDWFRARGETCGSAYNDTHTLAETLERMDEAIRDAKAEGI